MIQMPGNGHRLSRVQRRQLAGITLWRISVPKCIVADGMDLALCRRLSPGHMPYRAVSRTTCRMRTLEIRIPPLALVLIFAAAMAAIAYAVPASIAIPGRLIIAGAFVFVGAAVALAGVIAFRLHKTTVNPLTPDQSSTLVAIGIYRFSRNPMYLGFLLALLGWGVYLSNWASLLLLPVFVAYMNRFQIQPEERALTELFGQQFVAYARSVRRWL